MHLPRLDRYSLGIKIDNLFTETMELIFFAGYSAKTQKLAVVYKASTKLNVLKFFLKILWEMKALDNKKYIQLSQPLSEIGKMLGGWIKQLQKETLPNNGRE